MGEFGRRRDLLHVNQLEAFAIWAVKHGYERRPNTAHPYNCLFLELQSCRGLEAQHLFYRRKPPSEHITVPHEAVPLVMAFLKHKRRRKNG